jgi:hypothetical protein
MKKIVKIVSIIVLVMLILWFAITIWVQAEGAARIKVFGNEKSSKKALIIYDPDPFYNLDQQVCESFANALKDNDWQITVATVKAIKKTNVSSFNLYVFCANTYNWEPDWSVSRYIKRSGSLYNKNVVAITLGAGSTEHSQKALEVLIKSKSSILLGSKSFWLLKPNDETRTKESNIKIVNEQVKKWALELNESINY